ncbi:MAG: DEAD/DEAH box helicase [Candidatus Hydrogenedentes bacterium]|nr:DEAD/DEAH box helicase [Candidatus Hydrogenedentota bacterium]
MEKSLRKRRKVKKTAQKTSPTRKPEHLSVDEWQRTLRREYGRAQSFRVKNVGQEPVYSEFAVTNPASGRTYRVAIRGRDPGLNFCSCPDFSVNTLGTCKHIEWLIAMLMRKHGAKKAFAGAFRPAYTEVFLEYGAQRRVRFQPGTDCPSALLKAAERYFDPGGYLHPGSHKTFDTFVRASRSSEADVRIYDDAIDFVARLRDDECRREAIAEKFDGPAGIKALNAILKVKLYPYQREGALFAAKAGRCLIADDMGLGKTIQSIAAVEILARTTGIERVLVVCPTALKYQWKQEIERFTARFATVLEGFKLDREKQYASESFYKITNYETVHRDLDIINGWHPDLVLLDEAQRIKNWETRRAKSIKQIDSTHAIVLTGTPLENRLAELHSIMEFVDRFHLGPLFRFLDEHQHTDPDGRVIGYKHLDRIKTSLSPVLLRRHKRDVLQELPERTDKHLFVEMTAAQRAIHEEFREVVAKIIAKWRRRGFLSDEDQRRLMVALQYMRMACNSTYLIDKTSDEGPKMDECCILLDDILAIPENKAVIFSQWIGTHELLIRRFEAEDRSYAFYHGSLDGKARKKTLDDFKRNGKCRILLCTETGGVGLNLQEASVVINMDQPWNPAVLEQRIGRVHRLGQHRNVQVYHFVSRGTIEHGMLGVLKFKSSLSEGVLDGGESEIFLGGTKMKQFMESVEKVAESIPLHVPTVEETSDAIAAQESAVPVTGEPATDDAPAGRAPQQPWDELLAAGLDLLGKLGQVMQPSSTARTAASPMAGLIARNEQTGAAELRIPLPDAETAVRVSSLLEGLANVLRASAQVRK